MTPPIYGIVAEFADLGALVAAAHATRAAGYAQFEAYSPFPSEALTEADFVPPVGAARSPSMPWK